VGYSIGGVAQGLSCLTLNKGDLTMETSPQEIKRIEESLERAMADLIELDPNGLMRVHQALLRASGAHQAQANPNRAECGSDTGHRGSGDTCTSGDHLAA
jgi:hypothetical protein